MYFTNQFSSTIIEETISYSSTLPTTFPHVAYYYFTFRDPEKQKRCNILRSVIAQVISSMNTIPKVIQKLYHSYRSGESPLDILQSTLKSILEATGENFIIIDALDEC